MMRDPALRRGLALLGRRGLSFDAWVYHTQLGELAQMAAAVPETQIVLNHFGGPLGIGPYAGRGDHVFAEWSRGIRELARCPNVSLKLGGLGLRVIGQHLAQLPAPPGSQYLADLWRPYVQTAMAFGQALHVPEQFPGGQGFVQLHRRLERVQAPGRRRQ